MKCKIKGGCTESFHFQKNIKGFLWHRKLKIFCCSNKMNKGMKTRVRRTLVPSNFILVTKNKN